MSDKIVITIFHEYKTLGTVIYPYVAVPLNPMSLRLVEPLTPTCCNDYSDLITPEIKQLICHADKYSENTLHKLFCKDKKRRLHDFIDSVDAETASKFIRPYIEKHLSKVLSFLSQTATPLFIKDSFDQTISTACNVEISSNKYLPFFSFIRNEEGIRYSLQIKQSNNPLQLDGPKTQIICQHPCWLKINRTLYHIEGIDALKLKPFFTKPFVLIPKRMEETYFRGFIADTIKKFDAESEGFAIQECHLNPKPVLVITQTLDLKIAVRLRFDYGQLQVDASETQSVFVKTHIEKDKITLHKIFRNRTQEQHWIAKLTEDGFSKEQQDFLLFPIDYTIPEIEKPAIINWINFNKERLIELGFSIDESFFENEYFTDNLELVMESSEKTDWFDVNIVVKFGEYSFPFSRLKKYITHGIREFELPDRKKVVIPEEWFARFQDLLQLGTISENGNFELAKFHFNLLEEISGIKHYAIENLSPDLNPEKIKLPLSLKAQLRPYQSIGFDWMYQLQQNGFGGILADDMGLGKTLQTISLILKLREEEKPQTDVASNMQLDLFTPPAIVKPILIVMPLSLLYNWEREIRRFAPTLHARNLTEEQGWRTCGVPLFTDVALISYGTMRNYADLLSKTNFRCIILDESQNIKNPTSKTYQAVMSLKGEFRLSISGTPIENRLTDLWAQFNFVNPGLLGCLTYFKKEFAQPIEKNNNEAKQERLKNLIQPFLLRRTKEMVASDLPELTKQTIYCSMSEAQHSLYESEKSKIRNWVMEEVNRRGMNRSSILILKALHTLRLLANHPSLTQSEYTEDSGKSNAIFEQLSAIVERGHKVLIFSSYVKHLHLVERFLKENQIGHVKLTGSLKQKERNEVVQRFQEDPMTQVFLISLKAGGTGLNLTAADYVFIIDPWWNPAAEAQALNRAHRIGQEKKVFVYRFITRQTIEEKIQLLQEKKSALSDLFQGTDNPLNQIKTEELSDLLS